MDYGSDALDDQKSLLDQMNMAHVGSGKNLEQSKQWVLQQCGDVKVAVIAFDTTAPWAKAKDTSGGNFYLPCSVDSMDELNPIIKQAKQHAHIVMVTVHWGANWQEKPKKNTIDFAHAMIDAGVDAILGHSSHILQGVELYSGCPIIYDMGTLISDRVSQNRIKDEAYFELKLSKKGIHELIITPIFLYRCRARRSKNSKKRILKLINGLSMDMGTKLIERDGKLVLPLIPDWQERVIKSLSKESKVSASNKNDIRYLSEDKLKQFEPQPLKPEGTVRSLGGGLEVGGYRHPEAIAPGYAFVFEIRFRCLEKQEKRWRAEITFLDEENNTTKLRYPVSDGSWHNTYTGTKEWYADQTLVRLPPKLKNGSYQLFWNLWTRDEDKNLVYWRNKGVAVGHLDISENTQIGVAGVDWDKKLLFRDVLP